MISPAGQAAFVNPTHRSQLSAARLSRSAPPAAHHARVTSTRSVCRLGAVGGFYSI